MKQQDFLSLNESEQGALIRETGCLLINFFQGNISIQFYRLGELFVKITTNSDGFRQVDVTTKIPFFKLSEGFTSSDYNENVEC